MTTHDPTDEDLLRRCLTADEDAWDSLYRRYGEGVFKACWAATRSDDEAEDLSSTVWFNVFRGLAGHRSDSAFRNWLFTIVRNEIRDWIIAQQKRRQREATLESDEDGDAEAGPAREFPDDTMDPRASAMVHERLQVAEDALGQLSEDCQRVLRFKWQEFTDLEIAEMIGKKHKALEAQRARCEQKFLAHVQEIRRREGHSIQP